MRLVELDPRSADAALLDQLVAVETRVSADEDPLAPARVPEDVLGLLRHGWGLSRLRHAVVLDGERLLGYATASMRDHDNTHAVEAAIRVDPAERRRGAGRLLLSFCTDVARAEGRRLLVGELARYGDGRLFGLSVGAKEALVYERNMCRLADVPTDALEDPLHPSYELVRVAGQCPDDLVDDYAQVKAGMCDTPLQELEWQDEVWDAAHLRSYLASFPLRQRTHLSVVARHRESGALAGLTEVILNDLSPSWAEQSDTVVLPDHRGHGLGLAVKAEMVRWLRAEHPGVDELETWNADDNRWMLAVNRRLGYRFVNHWAEWQLPV